MFIVPICIRCEWAIFIGILQYLREAFTLAFYIRAMQTYNISRLLYHVTVWHSMWYGQSGMMILSVAYQEIALNIIILFQQSAHKLRYSGDIMSLFLTFCFWCTGQFRALRIIQPIISVRKLTRRICIVATSLLAFHLHYARKWEIHLYYHLEVSQCRSFVRGIHGMNEICH